VDWIHLAPGRDEWQTLVNRGIYFQVGISWLSEWLWASQEELCSESRLVPVLHTCKIMGKAVVLYVLSLSYVRQQTEWHNYICSLWLTLIVWHCLYKVQIYFWVYTAMWVRYKTWATTDKDNLLYQPGYSICCICNLTEEKSRVNMFEFPTGIWVPQVCWT
jgi:hypothetical protein